MPRIQTPTAQTGPGIIQTPSVNPNSFGAQAFSDIAQLGKGFSELGHKIQHNQDQLDLLKLSSQYEVQLAETKDSIAKHPDLGRHEEMLSLATEKLQDDMIKQNPDVSSAVQTAFVNHAHKLDTTAMIDLLHQGRAMAVERQVVDVTNRTQELVDTQSMVPPGEAFGRDTGHIPGQVRGTVEHLIQSFTNNGTLHPLAAEKLRDQLNNRYWEQRATEFPDHVMQVVASGKLGFDDFNMDQAKAQHYNAIAVNVLNNRQALADRAAKEEEAAIKRGQENNARIITADILEGKPLSIPIPTLLRTRGLTDNDGRTLSEMQTKMQSAPDLAKYQKGLAADTEARLTAAKYDNKPLQSNLGDVITDDFMRDRITKDEYGHLMGVLRSVDDYKHQSGTENHNQDVSHAHANLQHELRTTGPADKYDALSEQTIVSADQFFWRKMTQNPNADPWAIAKEASGIFKPVIEKRLGLSKTDKSQLDDAKMQGLVHAKVITPAAHQAYKNKEQETEGWRIVQETLKNLPPPPPPGWYQRFFEKKAEPRKAPGVMGE